MNDTGKKTPPDNDAPAGRVSDSGDQVAVTGEVVTAPICGARTRKDGAPCQRPAGWGTSHAPTADGRPGVGRCKLHGGSTRTHVNAAERQRALQDMASLDVLESVDPFEALDRALALATHRLEQAATQTTGDPMWARVEVELLDRVARLSRAAVDAGLHERRAVLAERQGDAVAWAFRGAMAVAAGEIDDRLLGRIVEEFGRRLETLERTDFEDVERLPRRAS